MPTAEQLETTMRHIADLASRRFVGDSGEPCGCIYPFEEDGAGGFTFCHPPAIGESVAFAELRAAEKVELLVGYVDWDGFSKRQAAVVIQNVIDGKEQKHWMDGVDFAGEMDAYASRHANPTDHELER